MARKYPAVILFFILAFMTVVSAASAAEYIVTISPEYQTIMMDETAEYEVTVRNNMDTTENFEIYSSDVMWDVTTKPVSDRILTIEAGLTKTTTVQLKPLYVNPGLYGVSLNVRVSGKKMLIKNYLMVGVNDLNPPADEYLPAIRSTIHMDGIVDPRENVTIELELENQNRRNMPEIDIRVRSNVINTDYKTGLGPLEKKMLTITIPIDPLTPPQADFLRFLIFTTAVDKTYQFEATPFEFDIMHYGGIVEDITTKKAFMKTTKIITLTNEGNGDIIDVYKIQKGFFERMFTSSEPASKGMKEEGERYMGWTVSLGPYEKQTITVTTNYRMPFWILCAIAAVFLLYYLLRSPIVIHKSATVLATKEGGISELKVLIVLKNRTGMKLKHVNLIDKVPHIAEVSKDFEIGTLHPTKVLKHPRKGTLIKWELKELDRFEERVLAYKIKSKLSVLGDFKLPVVVAKFTSLAGKDRSTHSNSVTLVGA